MNKALCKIAAAQRLSRIAEPCTAVVYFTAGCAELMDSVLEYGGTAVRLSSRGRVKTTGQQHRILAAAADLPCLECRRMSVSHD
jgi:hypothetical protein